MTIINGLNFGEFRLSQALDVGASVVKIVAISNNYTLHKQRSGEILQTGFITIVETNNSKIRERIRFDGVTYDGIDFDTGFKKYTLTIATASDGITKMRGTANDGDSTNNILNVIPANKNTNPFSINSKVAIAVGYEDLISISDSITAQLDDAIEQINQDQADFELQMNTDYTTFTTTVNETVNTAIETLEINNQEFKDYVELTLAGFSAGQLKLTALKTTGFQFSISMGDWVWGDLRYFFIGGVFSAPPNAQTYYWLNKDNVLQSGTSLPKSDNAYPIAWIQTNATEIVNIKNFGGAYTIPHITFETLTVTSVGSNGELLYYLADGYTCNIEWVVIGGGKYPSKFYKNGVLVNTMNYNENGVLISIS